MNEENRQKLIAIAPDLFSDPSNMGGDDLWFGILEDVVYLFRDAKKRWQDCVVIRDRIRGEGKEVPPWLLKYFEKYPEDPLEHFKIEQVKSKFDGLRIYISPVPEAYHDYFKGILALAEAQAYRLTHGRSSHEDPFGV
jgi:hypothetical protein